MLPEGLLEEVRNFLDVTYVDASGDLKLTGIIARGMMYLDLKAGAAMDYSVEDLPKTLLLNYCLYDKSKALDEFETNYLSIIMSMEQREGVKAYKALTSLSTLTVGVLVLSPVFDPATTFYTASTPNAGDVITANPTDPFATIAIVNGTTAVINGPVATWAIENVVIITITNGSAVTTYTLKINKVA